MNRILNELIRQAMTQLNDFNEYVNWLDDARFTQPLAFAHQMYDNLIELKSNMYPPITETESLVMLNS